MLRGLPKPFSSGEECSPYPYLSLFLTSLSGLVLLLLTCKHESHPLYPQSTLAVSGVAIAVLIVAFALLDTVAATQKRT